MKLQQNEGTLDRVVRVIAGVALLAVMLVGIVAAPWSYVAGIVGAILLVTGVVGFCPLYAIGRISTRSAKA